MAFKRERVAARRLSRGSSLSPLAALREILERAGAPAALDELIAERLTLQAEQTKRRDDRRQAAGARRARNQAERLPDPLAWHAWFDGSALPNPGRLGIGAILNGPDGSVRHISRAAGMGDSSAAEYRALIAVLEIAVALRVPRLIVHGDSQVVIQDLTGQVPVRTGMLASLRQHAELLVQQLASVELVWIPRARNAVADALARSAVSIDVEVAARPPDRTVTPSGTLVQVL